VSSVAGLIDGWVAGSLESSMMLSNKTVVIVLGFVLWVQSLSLLDIVVR